MTKLEKFLMGFRIALGALVQAQKSGVVRIKELPIIEVIGTTAIATVEAVKAMEDLDGDGQPG